MFVICSLLPVLICSPHRKAYKKKSIFCIFSTEIPKVALPVKLFILMTYPTVPLLCTFTTQTHSIRSDAEWSDAQMRARRKKNAAYVSLLFSAINFLCVILLCKTKNFSVEIATGRQRKMYLMRKAIMLHTVTSHHCIRKVR